MCGTDQNWSGTPKCVEVPTCEVRGVVLFEKYHQKFEKYLFESQKPGFDVNVCIMLKRQSRWFNLPLFLRLGL